jgi:hypothetical protein
VPHLQRSVAQIVGGAWSGLRKTTHPVLANCERNLKVKTLLGGRSHTSFKSDVWQLSLNSLLHMQNSTTLSHSR